MSTRAYYTLLKYQFDQKTYSYVSLHIARIPTRCFIPVVLWSLMEMVLLLSFRNIGELFTSDK